MSLPPAVSKLLAVAALLLLPACTIVSETPLVSVDETVALAGFPDGFTVDFYDEDGTDAYKRGAAPTPMSFAFKDGGYAATDASMGAHFVPRTDGSQLIWVSAADGNMYGIAKLSDNGVLELHMVLDEASAAAFAAVSMPADIGKDIDTADGGIMVRSRPALDFVIELIATGQIAQAPMVGFVSKPGEPLPKRLVRDGEGWAVEN
jgi:hypothetical protein